MTEAQVNLNVHEIGVILSALQQLDVCDEKLIAREYGSVSALHNRLYMIWEKMDQTEIRLDYDAESPSF